MWTEARGQNLEQAHVGGIKVEMKWTGMWWAMKESGDLGNENVI